MSIHARGADQHADGRLEAVLRAAAAPAHPAELAGEQQAVAAFRAAATAAPRRSILARILTVKVLAIGGVAASTGVVLAAVSGVLPPLSPERPAGPTVEVPAVVTTTSQSAETPLTGNPPALTERSGPVTPPAATGPSEDPSRQPHDRPGDDRDKKDKGDKDEDQDEDQDAATTDPADPRGRSRTPDSSAPGAVTAVPPSGATPPTKGG